MLLRRASTLARFWKNVSVEHTPQNTFKIMLDNRNLKSPDGKVVEIKNKSIALCVAAEWEAQQSVLKPHSLPLTSIITRSHEMHSQEFKQSVKQTLLKYLATDTILYHHDFPEPLVDLQSKYWTPLLSLYKQKTNLNLKPTLGFEKLVMDVNCSTYFTEKIDEMTALEFAAFERAVLTSKSFLIGFALVKRWISVDLAVNVARVEVLSQIQRWGEVEDTHDVDREEMKRSLGAATIVVMNEKSNQKDTSADK